MRLPSNNSLHLLCYLLHFYAFMLFLMESPPLAFCSRSATGTLYPSIVIYARDDRVHRLRILCTYNPRRNIELQTPENQSRERTGFYRCHLCQLIRRTISGRKEGRDLVSG
jgi:hypothetical protein